MQLAFQVLNKVLPAAACVALLSSSPLRAAGDQPSVPYVPTPQAVVERMLAMAKVTAGDYLIDLGSGDGRIVVTAARKYGTRGFGVDLNPVRIDEANENARRNRVTDKVAFYQRNLFETDLSQATVITMYLLPRVNLQLRPKLLDLKPGTRLVSHDFDMGDWKADEYVRMDANDKFSGAGGDSDIYLWIVPAKVAGTWRSQLTAGGKPQSYEIRLEQKYQSVGGTVRVNGKPALMQGAKLSGAELSFAFTADINGAPVKHEFSGRVDGGRIAGEAALSGGRLASRAEWIAERTEAAR
ncbi:MAG: class I SAM-dependent methyltransferase [Burkholderiales bacterium]|nr:class I SAM-dependent methyltransferase [Burkholderiales bacterium]